MKNLGLMLLLTLSLIGCSTDDDGQFDFQAATIRDVFLPDTLVKGETYNFEITYNRPTNCHAFAGFDYEKRVNERFVGVITAVEARRNDCTEEQGLTGVATLRFFVEREDFYIFQFYQGLDSEDNPLFLTKEIPVRQE